MCRVGLGGYPRPYGPRLTPGPGAYGEAIRSAVVTEVVGPAGGTARGKVARP